MKRKAQVGKFISIIILIIAVVILLSILMPMLSDWNSSNMREQCRASAVMRNKVSLEVSKKIVVESGTYRILPLQCPKIKTDFYNKGVKENGKKKEVIVDNEVKDHFNELTQDIIYREIAEQMKLCWYQFGEGIDVFQRRDDNFNDVDWFFGGKSDGVACFICNDVEFKLPSESFYDIEHIFNTYAFTEYLHTTKMPGSDLTYGAYLYNYYLHSADFENYLEAGHIPKENTRGYVNVNFADLPEEMYPADLHMFLDGYPLKEDQVYSIVYARSCREYGDCGEDDLPLFKKGAVMLIPASRTSSFCTKGVVS